MFAVRVTQRPSTSPPLSRKKRIISNALRIVFSVLLFVHQSVAFGDVLRKAETTEQLLKGTDIRELANETRLRGDSRRGAVLFFRSAAACVSCHASGDGESPLGPNLAKLNEGIDSTTLTDTYLIQSLLFPSRDIRKGFETAKVLTKDGTFYSGIIVEDTLKHLMLRSSSDLEHPVTIDTDSIETKTIDRQSMMPDGLMSALKDQSQFFDLAAYVIEVARGGLARARELKPTSEQLAIKEDWLDLDHAGILKKLKAKDFEAGRAIYNGFCVDCHGADGNRPMLPTARAFGTQKMKFGADPLKMFTTLTRGNGLMGPMSHLTPNERYQVVYYIREKFMKPTNPDYKAIDREYLESLPKGSKDGSAVPSVDRDFGPALGSQLEQRIRSALTVKLGNVSVCYDLHTMNMAGAWKDGFLDLDNTQHIRSRGEGTANPKGSPLVGLQGWRWGHDGSLDYSLDGLLPRGPMHARWMNYRGYYLHDQQVVLSYQIDGREILETLYADSDTHSIRHRLEVGPGKSLVLAAAQGAKSSKPQTGIVPLGESQPTQKRADASSSLAVSGESTDGVLKRFSAVAFVGEVQGCECSVDDQQRIVLNIAASEVTRHIEVVCHSNVGVSALVAFGEKTKAEQASFRPFSVKELTRGGPVRWRERLKTVGARGLQKGGYALDTIAIPESTPWKTWFRTSALDFLSDGRMLVTTYGGDVWVVSGVDNALLNLSWKRFASGLYEPMGIKVVGDSVYVTCKDRVVRLHDIDKNDEADFYENFSADTDVSIFFHAFNFDLQSDSDGNFYYAKGGHDSDFALPGAVIKISPDGSKQSVYCTGFRVPNGMGSMPDGRMTSSDNQGQWMPASKVSMLRENGFYGWVPTYNGKDKWSADGGKIDTSKVAPPKSFDAPMVWMPQEFDNSSGGQLWVDDPRWGPLSGRLLHMSFGKGWMSYMMLQEFETTTQAAIIRLPFDFRTGIMRGRVNPKDGQVYACGLQGWNGEGRIGLTDQGIQRLRYTGRPFRMISDCKVEKDRLRIDFNFDVDAKSAMDTASYSAKQWNYRWQATYGSEMYSPRTREIGAEEMEISSVGVATDRRSIQLFMANLKPVDQVHLKLKILGEDGTPFEEEVYWTIHEIPK